jgi:hypothetical protein
MLLLGVKPGLPQTVGQRILVDLFQVPMPMVTMNRVSRFSYDVTQFVDVSHGFASPLVDFECDHSARMRDKRNIK